MKVDASVEIDAPREAVWTVIADIPNAAKILTGIQKLEVLEQPPQGLVGLKWRETRVIFGKSATETMWVTAARENESYEKRAESNGCIFLSGYRITDRGGRCVLTMDHETRPVAFMRRILMPVFGLLFKGVMRKLMLKDLSEIKATVEEAGGRA